MKSWVRIPNVTLCGGCGAQLEEGAAVMETKISGIKRAMIRGECCAGDAPPDLPALTLHGSKTRSMKPLKAAKPEWLPYREQE